MRWHSINTLLPLVLIILLTGCDQKPMSEPKEASTMQPINYTCTLEKDHNPPLDPEADKYFQAARKLEKTPGLRNWPAIIENYQQAVDRNHWKAMNNLAALYRSGKRSQLGRPGIDKAPNKAVALYAKMVELKVPMGYYNWAIAIGHGEVPNTKPSDAGIYMIKAAELGYPMAQVALGNHYSFGLPLGEQRDDIAEQYFKCAGKQDNIKALEEVAEFYKIAKKNKPLAAYYYQKATSLGSETGAMVLETVFAEGDISQFGYTPNKDLEKFYNQLMFQLQENPELRLPNLMKDHPLPRHPTQGYDADNPDVRPAE